MRYTWIRGYESTIEAGKGTVKRECQSKGMQDNGRGNEDSESMTPTRGIEYDRSREQRRAAR